VAEPDQFVNPLAMLGGDVEDNPQNLPAIPEGMGVHVKGAKDGSYGGLDEVATVAPESVYRVEIITEVGAVKKRLNAVYDMKYTRSQSQGEGAWLYVREE
jgi:hypothetical protein